MKRYIVASKQRTGANTTAVMLQPVDETQSFDYAAGQYVAVGFRRGWQRTPMRCFSATTVPNEHGDIGIAFRTAGKFTNAFAELQPGSHVDVEGPFGDFVVSRDETRPLLFLAGGIGITPFISLLQDISTRRNAQPATLLYSVRSLEDVPFAAELMRLDRDFPHITVRFLTDDTSDTARNHPMVLNSKLSMDVLRQFSTVGTQYYICGPAGYSAMCHRLLDELEVSDVNIHNEAFSQASKMTVAGFALQKMVYGLFAAAILTGAGLFMAKDAIAQHEANEAASQQTTQTDSQSSDDASYTTDTSTSDTYQTTTPSSNSSSGSAPSSSSSSSTYSAPTYQTYQAPNSSVS